MKMNLHSWSIQEQFPRTFRRQLGLGLPPSGPVRLLLGLASQLIEFIVAGRGNKTTLPYNPTEISTQISGHTPHRPVIQEPRWWEWKGKKKKRKEKKKTWHKQASNRELHFNPVPSGTHSVDTVAEEVEGSVKFRNIKPIWATQQAWVLKNTPGLGERAQSAECLLACVSPQSSPPALPPLERKESKNRWAAA